MVTEPSSENQVSVLGHAQVVPPVPLRASAGCPPQSPSVIASTGPTFPPTPHASEKVYSHNIKTFQEQEGIFCTQDVVWLNFESGAGIVSTATGQQIYDVGTGGQTRIKYQAGGMSGIAAMAAAGRKKKKK